MIEVFNWRSELNLIEADAIGDDIVLLEEPIISTSFDGHFRIDVTTGIICSSGSVKGAVNLKKYEIKAPCFFIVLPDQILEYGKFSDDFEGNFIVLSTRFTNSLFESNIQDKFSLFHSVLDNPWTPLNEQELEAMLNLYKMMQLTIRMKNNPHRMDILKLLIKAFYMGLSYQFHKIADDSKKSKQEIVVENFINYVYNNYNQYRNIDFYANKLSLTPKYLSKIIKDHTGKSATGWINNYVILEAKALLQSTNMTVQQISSELNFPSQSFFGKYFKRHVGVSPKEYKNRKEYS